MNEAREAAERAARDRCEAGEVAASGPKGARDGNDYLDEPATDDGAQLESVRTYWERIGRSAPFWGVLTDVRFKGRVLDGAVADDFWSSGAQEVELLDRLLRQHAGEPPSAA